MSLRCDITEGIERFSTLIDDECRAANIREGITISISLERSLVAELFEKCTTEVFEEWYTELVPLSKLEM
jgi:hypothetical protein